MVRGYKSYGNLTYEYRRKINELETGEGGDITALEGRVTQLENTSNEHATMLQANSNNIVKLHPNYITTPSFDPSVLNLEVNVGVKFVQLASATTQSICGVANSSMGYVGRIADSTYYMQINTVEGTAPSIYDCRYTQTDGWVAVKIAVDGESFKVANSDKE